MFPEAPDPPPSQMTVPELLEAREVVRARLRMGTGGARKGFGLANLSARNKLLTILREIEAELTEQGYTGDAAESPPQIA